MQESDSELKEQILKLEMSLAHVEKRYDELNEVVIEQGKLIHRLQGQLRRVTESVEREEVERIRANNQKPPHSVA